MITVWIILLSTALTLRFCKGIRPLITVILFTKAGKVNRDKEFSFEFAFVQFLRQQDLCKANRTKACKIKLSNEDPVNF